MMHYFIWPHNNSMTYIRLYDYTYNQTFFWFIPRDNDVEDIYSGFHLTWVHSAIEILFILYSTL